MVMTNNQCATPRCKRNPTIPRPRSGWCIVSNATIHGWFPRICHGSVSPHYDDDVDDMMKRLCVSAEGKTRFRAKLVRSWRRTIKPLGLGWNSPDVERRIHSYPGICLFRVPATRLSFRVSGIGIEFAEMYGGDLTIWRSQRSGKVHDWDGVILPVFREVRNVTFHYICTIRSEGRSSSLTPGGVIKFTNKH